MTDGVWLQAQAGDHDPETYFYKGREFSSYDFKSSSTNFDVMYDEFFCGTSGVSTQDKLPVLVT